MAVDVHPAPPAPISPLVRPRPAWGTLSAAAALTTLIAAGVAVALAAAAGPVQGKLVPVLHRLVVAWVLGPLHSLGVATSEAGFRREYAVMGVAYVAAVVLAPRIRLRWLVAAVVALHVIFGLAPLMLSTDVFNYVEYAWLLTVQHVDPYSHTPASLPGGPVWTVVHWRHTRDAYGPLFTLATAPLGSLGAAGAVWAFKSLAVAASLACAGLVAWTSRRLGRPPARALAAFGLNPMLLVATVGGGHNDLVMLAVLLGGTALLMTRRELAGGAAAAAAIAIKATAGLAVPFLVLASGRRLRAAAGVTLGVLAAAGLAYVAFPDHALGMLRVLHNQQTNVSPVSIPLEVTRVLGGHVIPAQVHPLSLVALGLLVIGLMVWVWRGGDVMAAVAFAFVAVLATTSWMLPWYTVWPLAFAALARRPWPLVAVLALQVAFGVGEVVLR